MPREKYEPPNPRRAYTIMTPDEIAAANNKKQMSTNDQLKSPYGWCELEITGSVKNLSPNLFQLSHLTVLYLNDNNLSMVPPEITRLSNLMYLDLSSNKLRSLPPEIGDLIKLRELHLNHNYIRTLPLELGRLFQLVALGLKGNPLAPEILHIYSEANGTSKLLTYLLDNLMMIACHGSQQQGTVDISTGNGPKNVGSNNSGSNNNTFVPSLLQDPIPPRPFIPISVARQRVLLQARERERIALDYKKANTNPDGSDGYYSTGRMNYISAFANSTDGDSPMGLKNEGGGKGNGKKPDYFAIADREDRDGIIDTPNDDTSGSGSDREGEAPIFLGPESMRIKAAQRLKQSLKMASSSSSSRSSSGSSNSGTSASESSNSMSDRELDGSVSDFAMDSDAESSDAAKVKDIKSFQDGAEPGLPRLDKPSNPSDKMTGLKKRTGRKHKVKGAKKENDIEGNVDSNVDTFDNNTFTLMCYNILCDKYATRQLYGYCPTWAMAWDYRRELIRRQLESYSADILCLQEVETDQFHTFFLPQLRLLGYEGIFAPKSRAKTMREDERRYVDGCAIFYQTRKFELVRSHVVEFNQVAIAKAEGSENMLNRVMTKDNIGLTALLRTVPTPKEPPCRKNGSSNSCSESYDLKGGDLHGINAKGESTLLDNTGAAITCTKGGTLKGATMSGAKDDLSLLDLMSPGHDSGTLKAQDRVKSMGDVETSKAAKASGEPILEQTEVSQVEAAHSDRRHKRRLSETTGGLTIKTEAAACGSITNLPLKVIEPPKSDKKGHKVKRSASTLGQAGVVESDTKGSTPSNPGDTSAASVDMAPSKIESGSRNRQSSRKKNRSSNRPPRFRSKLLVVSTAHVHWDPEYSDVKIIQAMMIVHELKHFIRECYETYCLKKRAPKDKAKHKKPCASEADKAPSCEHIAKMAKESVGIDKTTPLSDTDTLPKSKIRATLKGVEKRHAAKASHYKGNNLLPLVLCGDLNSLPDSGVLEFLLTGRIEVNHADFKDLGYKACLAKLTCDLGDTGHYTHSFKLASAYKPEMMPYTNFTYDFCGVLDYILHSKKFLEAKALLGPLDQEWINRNKIVGAPHPNIPSDHFPIMVEYAFKEKPTHSRPSTNMDFTA